VSRWKREGLRNETAVYSEIIKMRRQNGMSARLGDLITEIKLLKLYQHISNAERNLIQLFNYVQYYAESLRKSKKMSAQICLIMFLE
jgi:hypothetical protein